MQYLFTPFDDMPTGALTRELLTGSTYVARTEGTGYWRNTRTPDPDISADAATGGGGGSFCFVA